MKHTYQDDLKPFLQQQITATANELNLTIEQIAEVLVISPRAYAYLKSGVSMCSASTLLIFLVKVCNNPLKFIEDAKSAINEIEKNLA